MRATLALNGLKPQLPTTVLITTLEILPYLQENTCAKVSNLVKLQAEARTSSKDIYFTDRIWTTASGTFYSSILKQPFEDVLQNGLS